MVGMYMLTLCTQGPCILYLVGCGVLLHSTTLTSGSLWQEVAFTSGGHRHTGD